MCYLWYFLWRFLFLFLFHLFHSKHKANEKNVVFKKTHYFTQKYQGFFPVKGDQGTGPWVGGKFHRNMDGGGGFLKDVKYTKTLFSSQEGEYISRGGNIFIIVKWEMGPIFSQIWDEKNP